MRRHCSCNRHRGRCTNQPRERASDGGWRRFGLATSVLVVVITIAIVNEAVQRRRRQRWSVLAQYVMLQLVRDARGIWVGLLELAGLMPPDNLSAPSIDAGAETVRDTGRLTAAARRVVAEPDRRRRLHASVTRIVIHNDEVLGRWRGDAQH
jgi:hypothetical protein